MELFSGESIGWIACERCDVTLDLGPTEESAEAVMDLFWSEHRHEAE